MADPVVEFVSEWIKDNVEPELTAEDVDEAMVQEHLSMLLAEAADQDISEEDIDDSGLDVPGLIEAALKKGAAEEADRDDDDDDE